jgi:hypothetical protein
MVVIWQCELHPHKATQPLIIKLANCILHKYIMAILDAIL